MARPLIFVSASIVVLSAIALAAGPASAAPDATVIATTATSSWRHTSSDPSGIAFVPTLDRFIVVDAEIEETSAWDGRNAWWVDRDGTEIHSWSTMPATSEPTDVAARGRRTLFMTDDRTHRVFVWRSGRDRRFGTRDDAVRSFKTDAFGSNDPEGVAFGGRSLFIANGEDGSNPRIYRITPGPDRRFDGPAPAGDDRVTSFSTAGLGISDPEGIAYDASNGSLLVISRSDDVIARITVRGRLIETIDLGVLGIRRAAGITLAPASDDPSLTDVYIVDRGVDNNVDPREDDGRLLELRLLA
jgi:DNA-binding beta-propeller fold protein YncE